MSLGSLRQLLDHRSPRPSAPGWTESAFSLPAVYAKARAFAIEHVPSLPVVGPRAIDAVLRKKYGSRVVTPLKVENYIQANRDEVDRAIEVTSVPYNFTVDPLNVCNLRCLFVQRVRLSWIVAGPRWSCPRRRTS